MADLCIFCSKRIDLWSGGDTMLCGGVGQPVCSDCWDQYSDLPALQRAKLALDTGRAREPEKVAAFLDEERERQEAIAKRRKAREEQLERARKGQNEVGRCCGFEMVREGPYTFADQTPFAFRMLPLYTPALYLFRCEICGQVKFFDASFFPDGEEAPIPEPEPETQVTCPVCGTQHSSLIGCPTCVLQAAQSGQKPPGSGSGRRPSKPSRSKPGKKAPWEK